MPPDDLFLPAEPFESPDHLGPQEKGLTLDQRFERLVGFFSMAEQEVQRLKGWRADWLESVPEVGLADLLLARLEVQEIVAEVPVVQARLRARLSAEDWDCAAGSTALSVDLRAEVLAHVRSRPVNEDQRSIPESVIARQQLHAFAHGEGEHAREVMAHLAGMRDRIESLIELHARHLVILDEAMEHALAMEGGEAQAVMFKLRLDRFKDIDYDSVRIAHGNAVMGSIEDLLEGFDDPDGFDELDDRYNLDNPNDGLFRKTVKWSNDRSSCPRIVSKLQTVAGVQIPHIHF